VRHPSCFLSGRVVCLTTGTSGGNRRESDRACGRSGTAACSSRNRNSGRSDVQNQWSLATRARPSDWLN